MKFFYYFNNLRRGEGGLYFNVDYGDVVMFFSVKGTDKWAQCQKWGGAQSYIYYRSTLIKPKMWGSPGPLGPLLDYISVANTSKSVQT